MYHFLTVRNQALPLHVAILHGYFHGFSNLNVAIVALSPSHNYVQMHYSSHYTAFQLALHVLMSIVYRLWQLELLIR